MEKKEFSPEQQRAIDTRDRTLLVSAAAGSGKTTTLTERIIRSLLDKEKPESIQNMLIVTFTNASVYDLKEKISKALTAAVNEHPEDKRLENELHSLGHAKIMTIDSFCNEIVRKNAERLGITPAYRIAESAETMILERSVISSMIDSAFEGELLPRISPKNFEKLCDALTGVKNTSSLADKLITLYEKTKSSIKGVSLFADFANNYLHYSKEAVEKTPYGKYIINLACESLKHYFRLSSHYGAPLLLSENAAVAKLGAQIVGTGEALNRAADEKKSYNEMRDTLFSLEFEKSPPIKEKSDEVLEAIEYKQAAKDMLLKLKSDFFSYTEEEWQNLFSELGECVLTLSAFLEEFSHNYFEHKRKKGCFEFADVERLAYDCLWKGDKLTDAAEEYREIFTSVYIDEYQDVNELQNKIFDAVSPTRARFMVGDIKQSIYGFRSARPEIFAKMKRDFPPLSEEYNEAASIFMSNNYRCDEGIVDFVNEVFDRLFGTVGESIGYVEEDKLKFKKRYTGFTPEYERAKICLIEEIPEDREDIEEDSEEDCGEEQSLSQPVFVAKKIKELIREGKRRDGSPIKAGDIAIILRTKKRFSEYENALKAEGIAASAAEDRDFFLNKEVLLAISLLSSIDNPTKDIHLAALMCSPLYSFTADELYIMKKEGGKSTLFASITEYSKLHPEYTKLSDFLYTLSRYRTLSEGMNADDLLTRLYHESGLLSIAARQGGIENLYKLHSYARKFEGSSYKGLYHFITYINNVIEKGATIDKNDNSPSDNDAVHIGTIHSAKGLEFPVVFLADTSDKIINLDTREKIAFSENFGISFLLRAPLGLALVDNPLQHVIHDYMDSKFYEEIIRLFYVALTRPKEKLYVVGTVKEDAEIYLEKMRFAGETLSPFSLRGLQSYLDMICASASNADVIIERPSDEKAQKEVNSLIPEPKTEDEKGDTGALVKEIKERFEYVYPKLHLTTLPEKMSVSRLSPTVFDGTDEADILIDFSVESVEKEEKREPVPVFISGEDSDKSAKRGIATHNFLQFFDIKNLRENGTDAELKRLCEKGFLSKKTTDLVRVSELCLFEKSELLCSMEGAKSLYREFRFNTKLPAELFTEDEEKKKHYATKTVLIQGVIDCLIENPDGTLRLIDYKTDRLSKEELQNEELARKKLKEKHSLQLSYYALAVEKIFGKKPTRVEVYSLPLGKTVEV